MTISACVKVGAATGFLGGLVSAAYFAGTATRASNNNSSATFAIGTLSIASFFGGPIVGAGAGLGCYGIKRLQVAPRPIQLTFLTIVGSGIAYKFGKNERSSGLK